MRPEPDPTLPWVSRLLLRVEVGSTAHGTGIDGHEDYDEIGVMALPWQHTIGIPLRPPWKETIVYRPGRSDTDRSGPGDYDLQVHSARKFAALAAQGNPSILMVLFGPLRYSTELGDALRSDEMVTAIWSEQARNRFLGYAFSQRQRLLGIRGGGHGRRGGAKRDDLVTEHGFDTKYAMHMLRLGFQGIEYMSTGRLAVPITGPYGQFLRDVRHGNIRLDEVLATAEANEDFLRDMTSDAPPKPDYDVINDWLLDVHRAANP